MSFITGLDEGTLHEAGYFLAHEECERKTRNIPQSLAETAANGSKVVPMGTIYPSNDGDAEGIVYEDVDVTSGAMPGSVVLKGTVYTGLLPKESGQTVMTSVAKTALAGKGITFVDSFPSVTRPY